MRARVFVDPGDEGLRVFGTAIGDCGVAWTRRGIVAVQLPETTGAATRARLQRRCPSARDIAPPPEVQRAIDGIVALLDGASQDLTAIELDTSSLTDFERRVYEAARRIPAGATSTYGEIAAQLGVPGDARGIGQALGRNPYPLIVPCHRVLAAGGRAGGFSAHGGVATKLRLLEIERRRIPFELT